MNQEQYDNLRKNTPNVEMIRPFWKKEDYSFDDLNNVTVLICQRQTYDATRLCLESLLRFYPDIPILVVDGNSQDESSFYLAYKALTNSNVKIWTRIGINSHGITMDEAILGHINTEYVLLMDSDIITMRPGYIEGMLKQLIDEKFYATGTLMLATRKNYACGVPFDETDVLRYAHPSCSLYHIPTYKSLNAPFTDHGAPCVYNMFAAEKNGLKIGYFPVDKYVAHLSGHSWVKPYQTIWVHDYNVNIKPFITFIVTNDKNISFLLKQSDHDFDIVTLGNKINTKVVIHGRQFRDVNSSLYDLRFKVYGEYVCILNESIENIDFDIVSIIKKSIIDLKAPDELIVGGLRIIKRHLFQEIDCFE